MVTFLRLFFIAYSYANLATLSEFGLVTTFMVSTTPLALWKHYIYLNVTIMTITVALITFLKKMLVISQLEPPTD